MNIKIIALLAILALLTFTAQLFRIRVKTKPMKAQKPPRKIKKNLKSRFEDQILQIRSQSFDEPQESLLSNNAQGSFADERNFYVYSDLSNVYYTPNPDAESELEIIEEWRRTENVIVTEEPKVDSIESLEELINDPKIREEVVIREEEVQNEPNDPDQGDINDLGEEKGELGECQVLRSCHWVTKPGAKKTLECHDELICLM